MCPKKPQLDVQSKEPVQQSSFKKKHVPLYKGKNCKVTICENIDSKSQVSRNSDKNCKEIKRPRKPRGDMWSVTKETDMQLPKPAIRRLCSNKHCQSTRCYKSPVRPMYDKHYQL